ncbi:Hypothetical predicted protein [Mytilus galloprovincialis]|uniref:Uncharacterized protein n=1 Tax=Mytilus galloprovincialis TaxID=29158 RepID=A0A8B6H4A3_MYTGA|nr:Hypothetical predicted protein [Mytilus galloprovincialis]
MTATIVEAIERKVRDWLGVPPSFTALSLYSRSTHLQLPLTSTLEDNKTRLRNDTFPTVVKGNTKNDEQHGAVRNENSRRRTKRGKISRAKPSRRVDEVEHARNEDHMPWAKLWRMQPFRISFILISVYNTLPFPSLVGTDRIPKLQVMW